MIFQILFIILCFCLDIIISNFLPHSFLPNDLVVTSCLGLSALVLSQRKMNRIDSLLITIIFGLLYDLFVSHSLFVCTIAFVIVNILVSHWQKHITESLIESFMFVFVTIFVKEFLVYFMMTLLSETALSFYGWLCNRVCLTLIVNGIFIIIIILISRYIEDMMLMREKRIRKEEKISWWKISLKQ